MMAWSLGKMPRMLDRFLTSAFSRSSGLALWSAFYEGFGFRRMADSALVARHPGCHLAGEGA